MNFLNSIIRGRLAPYFAGVLGVCYLLLVGFRGFGAATLDWIDAGRSLADEVRQTPASILEWTAESHEFMDLFAAVLYLVSPGAGEWALFGVSVVCGGAASAMIFFLGQRLAGALGGWMTLFFLLTCAPWMGLFTRVDPTVVVVPVFLGIVLSWHARTLTWWLRTLICAPLVATGILLWPGIAIVFALLVAIELIAPQRGKPPDQPGLTEAPTLAFDRLTTPALAAILLLLYPLFWPEPIESLGLYFISALELPATEFVFRGQVYPPARPPFYTGVAWTFEQLPLALVGALTLGVLWCTRYDCATDRRLLLGLASMAVVFLLFPVLFRSPRPLGADFTALFLAAGIPLASLATCRFFSHALGRNAPSVKVRQVAIGAFLLAGISILIEAPRAMETPETYRSPMSARIVGWTASGDMPVREEILPLRVIEASGVGPGTPLYTGGWERTLDAYQRMGIVASHLLTDDIDDAQVAIRRVPAIAVDRFNAYSVHHIPPLRDAQTAVIDDIHRPFFFVDRSPRVIADDAQ